MAQVDTAKKETYDDVAWIGSWRQRASGLWAAAVIGIIFGAATGVLAPLAPALIGAVAPSALPGIMAATVPIFASFGMAAGVVAGGLVGSGSGGVAAIAEELHRRQQTVVGSMGVQMPAPGEFAKPVKEQGVISKLASYVNPRALLIFTGLGLVGGVIYAAGAIAAAGGLGAADVVSKMVSSAVMPGLSSVTAAASKVAATSIMGLATPLAAAASYCVGAVVCFGGLFGFRFAHMTNDVRGVMASALSTKFGGEKAQEQAAQLSPVRAAELQAPVIDVQVEQVAVAPQHASKLEARAAQGFQEMLTQKATEPDCGCHQRH